MSDHLVFVYGSLKKGFHNNTVLGGAEFIGEDITLEHKFSMYSLGSYPAVIMGGTDSITGELYRVNDEGFLRLDHLEGYPSFYDRIKVPTRISKSGVWMYIINGERSLNYVSAHNKITGGTWLHK